LSLREEAIKRHFDKEIAKKAKEAAEKKEYIGRRIAYAKKEICTAFALNECPPLVITYNDTSYWPEMVFEVDGILFGYNLDTDWLLVKVSCPKCEGEWMRQFRMPVDGNGVRDLSWLGNELSMPADPDRHFCSVNQPATPPKPAPEPPKVVTYAIGSVEQRFLEALDELVFDAVDRHQN
jgi:hypothetical protein